MRGIVRHGARAKVLRVSLAAATLIAAAGSASAGNDSIFNQIFGGGDEPAPPPQYVPAAPDDGGGVINRRASRPLTVKLRRPKIAHASPADPAAGHAAGHVKVTIYDDPTLRRGDAVMTVKGMRIFAGSRTWPYRDSDFVTVDQASRLDKGLQKTLLALDSVPRQ